MAVFNPVRFSGPSFLTGSAAILFTVGVGKVNALKQIVFNNTSANTASVTVHLVPPAGTATTSNMIITALSVSPNSQLIWTADIPMTAGETLQALANTSGVITATTSGIEVVL